MSLNREIITGSPSQMLQYTETWLQEIGTKQDTCLEIVFMYFEKNGDDDLRAARPYFLNVC